MVRRPVVMTSGLRAWAWLIPLALVACGGDDDPIEPVGTGAPTGTATCVAGEAVLPDGSCLPAGMQPNGCAAGQIFVEDSGACVEAGVQRNGCAAGELQLDGRCVPAGIPPEGCAAGFEPDGDSGCEPILPATPCTNGQMAVVGETACREIMPCGAAPWGDIPVEGNTVYVDGGASAPGDGSVGAPFPTIKQALDDAGAGAIVAVAAGSYAEDLTLQGKAVRLWGRCPALVEIVGSPAARAAVAVNEAADGFELHGVAVTGEAKGVSIGGSSAIVLDRIWVHDTASFGVDAFDAGGSTATEFELRRSLIERTREQAVWIEGSTADIEGTLVQDTLPSASGYHGWGIAVLEDETTFRHATMTLRSSVVARSVELGVIAHASDATVEATAILDTAPSSAGRFGRALVAQTDVTAHGPTNMTVEGCVIDGCLDGGIFSGGSNVEIRHTVVRDVLANMDQGDHGSGITAQHVPANWEPSNLVLRQSLIERGTEAALFIGASHALVEGLYVRDTQSRPDGTFGRGMAVQMDPLGTLPSSATVRGSVFENSQDVGIFVDGSELTLEGVVVRNTVPRPADGTYGWGIGAQDNTVSADRATITMTDSVVEQNHGIGVMIGGSDVDIEGVLIDDTRPRPQDGRFGRGLNIQDDDVTGQRAWATVRSTVVSRSHEVGLLTAGAEATFDGVVVRDTQPGSILSSNGRGVVFELNPVTGQATSILMRWSRIADNDDVAMLVAGASVTLESTWIYQTDPRSIDGAFGDGMVVRWLGLDGAAELRACRVENSARGGIAAFGGIVALRDTAVVCNSIDLNGERINDVAYSFTDLGGNGCGCSPDDSMCRVLTSNLVPPDATDVE